METEGDDEKIDYEEAKSEGSGEGVSKLNKNAVRLLIFGGLGAVLLVAAVMTFGGGEEEAPEAPKEESTEPVGVDGEKRVEEMRSAAEASGQTGPDAGRPKSGEEVLKNRESKMKKAEKLQESLEEKAEESQEKQKEEEKKGPWEKAREQAQRRNARQYFQDAAKAKGASVFGRVERRVAQREEPGAGAEQLESTSEDVRQWRQRRARMLAKTKKRAGQGPAGGRRGEDKKEKFLNEDRYEGQESKRRLRSPSSEFVVQAGTMLPLVLETGINSDLPGFVRGRFSRPVYDTPTGEHLLIPAGTTVIGEYSSDVKFGGSRAQVVWTRLLLPNGDSLPLGNLPGTDLQGKTGYADQVDRHLGEYVGGVLVSSLAAAGAGAAAGDSSQFKREPEKEALGSAGETVAEKGQGWADKQLDAKPTIKVRPGLRVGAFVRKDLVLRPYKEVQGGGG